LAASAITIKGTIKGQRGRDRETVLDTAARPRQEIGRADPSLQKARFFGDSYGDPRALFGGFNSKKSGLIRVGADPCKLRLLWREKNKVCQTFEF
jgi:hypothetical protein